jgi:hypothetical protein
VTLTDGGEPERIPAQLVTANLFSTLGIPLHRGHGLEAADDQVTAALSRSSVKRSGAGGIRKTPA